MFGAAWAGAALLLPAQALGAEAFYGVTTGNVLVTFHSDSPGAIRTSVPIAGLAEGEHIIALDRRPRTNQLYGLSSTSRIYVIAPTTGSIVAVGPAFTPALAGGQFGFDFNPSSDRIRVVSDGRQNLRLNPDDGQVAGHDTNIAYAEGDSGAGSTPSAAAAAYSNNVPEAPETQLFVIDSARDALTLQNPPNGGLLATIGGLTADIVEPVSFDIGADGRAWVAARRNGATVAELFTVDLKTGALGKGSLFPAIEGYLGLVRGLATAGQVPDDKAAPVTVVAVDRRVELAKLRRAVRADLSCSEACSIAGTLQLRGRTVGEAFGKTASAGKVRLALRPSAGTRARAGRGRLVRLVLRVTVQDFAGNITRVRRSIRFEP